MTAFDLRGAVDRELSRAANPAPVDVARTALMRIPAEHREQALLQALATYVEARIHEVQDDPMPSKTYEAKAPASRL